MYVIYPAEELLRIYESPLRDRIILNSLNSEFTNVEHIASSSTRVPNDKSVLKKSASQRRFRVFNNSVNNKSLVNNSRKNSNKNNKNNNKNNNQKESVKSSSRSKKKKSTIMQSNRNQAEEGTIANNPLKDLTQANLNEPLKQHNGNTLKLVQTGESSVLCYV